jgi:hypothetical protein
MQSHQELGAQVQNNSPENLPKDSILKHAKVMMPQHIFLY